MTDLNLLSFDLAGPWSSNKKNGTATSDGDADFAAVLALQQRAETPAAGEKVDEPAASTAINMEQTEVRATFSSFQGIARDMNDSSENVQQVTNLLPGFQSNAFENRYAAEPVVDALSANYSANHFVGGAGKGAQFFSDAYEAMQANSLHEPLKQASSSGYTSPKIAEGAQPESMLMQSIGKSLANKESGNTGALRSALPLARTATNIAPGTLTAFASEESAQDNVPSTLAQFTDQQPEALHEGFISRHVKSLIGKILNLGRAANDSTGAQVSEPAANDSVDATASQLTIAQSADLADAQFEQYQSSGEAAFRVPASSGSGGFSRTATPLREPLLPKDGTLNAVGQTSEAEKTWVDTNAITHNTDAVSPFRKEKTSRTDAPIPQPNHSEPQAELPGWNPLAAPVMVIPSAAVSVSPVPEGASRNVAQSEEAMRTAQTAQVPFAEFYTSSVTTPRNYERAPGIRAARAQSLFKALDQPPAGEPSIRPALAEQLGTLPVIAPSKEATPGILLKSNRFDLQVPPSEGGTTDSENVQQAASLPVAPISAQPGPRQAGNLSDGVAPRFSLFQGVANDMKDSSARQPASTGLNREAKADAAARDWPAPVVSNVPSAQTPVMKAGDDQLITQQLSDPATATVEYRAPNLPQFQLQPVESQPAEIQTYQGAAEQIAIAPAPAAAEIQSQPFNLENKEVTANAAARPGETTPELNLNPEWLKTEDELQQDEQIPSSTPNGELNPAPVKDTQQVEMFVGNGRIAPTEEISMPATKVEDTQISIATSPVESGESPTSIVTLSGSTEVAQHPETMKNAAEIGQTGSLPDSEKGLFVQQTKATSSTPSGRNDQPVPEPVIAPSADVQRPFRTQSEDSFPEIQRPVKAQSGDSILETQRSVEAQRGNSSLEADANTFPAEPLPPKGGTLNAVPAASSPAPATAEVPFQAINPGGEVSNANVDIRSRETTPELNVTLESLKAKDEPRQIERHDVPAPNTTPRFAPVESGPQQVEVFADNQRIASPTGLNLLSREPQDNTDISSALDSVVSAGLPQSRDKIESPIATFSGDSATSPIGNELSKGLDNQAELVQPSPVDQEPLPANAPAEISSAQPETDDRLVEERPAPASHHNPLDPQSAVLSQDFAHRKTTPRSNASGIQVEYVELPQEVDVTPMAPSSLAEAKEAFVPATTAVRAEATPLDVRGPQLERDELRPRNLLVTPDTATSPVESKESFTSAAPPSEIVEERVANVAPHRSSPTFPPGGSQKGTVEASIRQAQSEELNTPLAENNIDAREARAQVLHKAVDQQAMAEPFARPSSSEQKPVKLDPRGEANVDATANDLPASIANNANNAGVSQTEDAKAEGPNATVRQLTPAVIEASEHLTPGKSHSLRLSLRPVELGQVEIQITRDAKGHVNAHLTVEREATGQTLSEGIPQLREALERAGLQVDRLIVSTGPGTGWNGEGHANQPAAQQFTRTSGSDFFEAEPVTIGGAQAAQDRLLNLHA